MIKQLFSNFVARFQTKYTFPRTRYVFRGEVHSFAVVDNVYRL